MRASCWPGAVSVAHDTGRHARTHFEEAHVNLAAIDVVGIHLLALYARLTFNREEVSAVGRR